MGVRSSAPRPPCPDRSCPGPHVVRNGTLAARSVLDAAIERQDRGTVIRRTPSRVEID